MPQLNLNFTNLPEQNTLVWEQLDHQQRQLVVEALARLLSRTPQPEYSEEPAAHD